MGKRKKSFKNFNVNKNIAKVMILHRVWNGITQTQLSDNLDITFQQIQKYEKCINRLPAESLIALCKIRRWDLQLFSCNNPEIIFEEWCKTVDNTAIDSPYPRRASQIQRSWDKIDIVGEQNYYNEHSPRYKNIINEMKGV